MDSRNESKQEMTWIEYKLRKLWLWRERQKTLKQLGALSNHMLKDIGLERGHIEATVNRLTCEQADQLRQQRQHYRRSAPKVHEGLSNCVSAASGPVETQIRTKLQTQLPC